MSPFMPMRVFLWLCACATMMVVACGSQNEATDPDERGGGAEAQAGGATPGTNGSTGGSGGQGGLAEGPPSGGSGPTGGRNGLGTGGKNAGGSGGTNAGPSSGGSGGANNSGSAGMIGTTGGAGAPSGEPAALKGITELHNQARRKAGVPDLVWDPALAAIAQAWANKCVDKEAPAGLIDHNANRGAGYPASVGENIFGSSGAPTANQAVASWVGEEKNYNYAANTCAGVCGHYTQVVWKTTQKLGCAVSQCAGLKFGGTLVCDYSPAGNVNGQRPY